MQSSDFQEILARLRAKYIESEVENRGLRGPPDKGFQLLRARAQMRQEMSKRDWWNRLTQCERQLTKINKHFIELEKTNARGRDTF